MGLPRSCSAPLACLCVTQALMNLVLKADTFIWGLGLAWSALKYCRWTRSQLQCRSTPLRRLLCAHEGKLPAVQA